VITLFLITGLFGSDVLAATNYSLLNQPSTTIAAPPVLLQAGTANASTIYANSTSAIVNVAAPVSQSAPIGQSWLTGWSYRQQHNITSASGADVGYQFNITISNATGTSNGNVCYADGHVRNSDFSDIRVTASDGITLLSIWNETVNSGTNATIWFKDTDNLTSTNSTVYVYYGNAGAPYVWNGTNTFLFFDDLSSGTLGKYDIQRTGTGGSLSLDTTHGNPAPSIKGSVSGGTAASSTWTIAGNSSSFMPNNYRVDMDVNLTGASALVDLLTNFQAFNGSFYVFRFDSRSSYYDLIGAYPSGAATTTVLNTTSIQSSTGTWLHMSAIRTGANLSLYKGGSLQGLGTLEATYTTNQTYQYSGGGIAVTTDGATSTDWFDNIIARSYVSPEPAQGAWGTEQSATVLNVVNQMTNAWNMDLQVYGSSNIARLSNATISFYDGTSSDQIVVNGGTIVQSQGALYNLLGGSGSTVYVSMSNLLANAAGTSYLYVYLEILTPNTSTFLLYAITFAIT
jgi:prepilin-type processing-associated H-X9-DG protein